MLPQYMKKIIFCLLAVFIIAFDSQAALAQSLEKEVAAAIAANQPELLSEAQVQPIVQSAATVKPAEPQKKKKLTRYEKKARKMVRQLEKERLDDSHRYLLISMDSKFAYYLDRVSARWIKEPDTNAKVIDVWLRLVDINSLKNPVLGQYMKSVPRGEYLLDHYYIKPYTRQVQFLCELDISGQPANNVVQNAYSANNWEYVIPGSVEDHIYNSVMAIRHDIPSAVDQTKPITQEAADFIERTLNISL